MRSDVEENIIWTYLAVQSSTIEGAYFAIHTFSAMKHSKARAKLTSYLRRGGVTNIRDVIQIISQILQLLALSQQFLSDNKNIAEQNCGLHALINDMWK
jgi:hypothetical protein